MTTEVARAPRKRARPHVVQRQAEPPPMSASETCVRIAGLNRMRRSYIRTINGMESQSLRFCMGACNRLVPGDLTQQATMANQLIAYIGGKGTLSAELLPAVADATAFLEAQDKGLEIFVKARASIEVRMHYLASQLPIYEHFIKPLKGVGLQTLANIVAETGDLANYKKYSQLWKRLGMAVMDGIAQGRLPSKLIGAERAKAWVDRGYSPERRSAVWNIGDCMIKARTPKYRAFYDARKQYEIERAEREGLTVVEAGKYPIGVDKTMCITRKHIALRAQRYMEKKFLRDLFYAWRALQPVANA